MQQMKINSSKKDYSNNETEKGSLYLTLGYE